MLILTFLNTGSSTMRQKRKSNSNEWEFTYKITSISVANYLIPLNVN